MTRSIIQFDYLINETWSLVFMFLCIKCIHSIEYKMYLQNEKMAKLLVFVDFSNKRRSENIYNFFAKWNCDELQKEEVVMKRSVKKVFSKISQNLQENTFVGFSFFIKLQAFNKDLWRLFLYKRFIFVDFL